MAEVKEVKHRATGRGETEDLDPRVKEELDILNSTSEEINKLEIELDHARSKFRSLLTDATQRLNQLYKKLGRCVSKARPYYELVKECRRSQAEAQRAVVKFHRANGIYRAAKETVALAEERLMSLGENGEKRDFDSAWQEMLNHATIKFMDSERDKTLSEQEHLQRASECAEIQKRMKSMEKSMPRTIPRSRPYFELKERLEFQLQQEKLNVEDLVRALQSAKVRYKGALATLEAISEEVHMKRKESSLLPQRTPGVGAENSSDISADLPSINLELRYSTQRSSKKAFKGPDIISDTSGDVASIASSDDYDVLSTDGSETGDDSPRLEPRRISHPISPLAREESGQPAFTTRETDHGPSDSQQTMCLQSEQTPTYDLHSQQGQLEGQNIPCQGQNRPVSCQSQNGLPDEDCHSGGDSVDQSQVKCLENGLQVTLSVRTGDQKKALDVTHVSCISDENGSMDQPPSNHCSNDHQVRDQTDEQLP